MIYCSKKYPFSITFQLHLKAIFAKRKTDRATSYRDNLLSALCTDSRLATKITIDYPGKFCFLLASAGSAIGGPTGTGVIDASQNSPMVLTEHGMSTNLSEHSRKHDSSNLVKRELASNPALPIRALAKHDFPSISTK
jgi:hypothetical protein